MVFSPLHYIMKVWIPKMRSQIYKYNNGCPCQDFNGIQFFRFWYAIQNSNKVICWRIKYIEYLLKCKTTTLQVEITFIEFCFVSNRMLPSWTMNTSPRWNLMEIHLELKCILIICAHCRTCCAREEVKFQIQHVQLRNGPIVQLRNSNLKHLKYFILTAVAAIHVTFSGTFTFYLWRF